MCVHVIMQIYRVANARISSVIISKLANNDHKSNNNNVVKLCYVYNLSSLSARCLKFKRHPAAYNYKLHHDNCRRQERVCILLYDNDDCVIIIEI
jgi:hypothetical protein